MSTPWTTGCTAAPATSRTFPRGWPRQLRRWPQRPPLSRTMVQPAPLALPAASPSSASATTAATPKCTPPAAPDACARLATARCASRRTSSTAPTASRRPPSPPPQPRWVPAAPPARGLHSCVSGLCLGDYCCETSTLEHCSRCAADTGECAACVPPYEFNGTDCIPPPPVTTTTTTLGPSGAACSGSPNCVSGLCLGDYCCETSTLEHCSRCAADTGECAACVPPYEFDATSGSCVHPPAPPATTQVFHGDCAFGCGGDNHRRLPSFGVLLPKSASQPILCLLASRQRH